MAPRNVLAKRESLFQGLGVKDGLTVVEREKRDGFNCVEKWRGEGTVFTCYVVSEELEPLGEVDTCP